MEDNRMVIDTSVGVGYDGGESSDKVHSHDAAC